MKVRQLIDALKKFHPDLDVLCYTENNELVDSKGLFRLLDIIDLQRADAETSRDENGTPTLIISHSDVSEQHVLIYVAAQF